MAPKRRAATRQETSKRFKTDPNNEENEGKRTNGCLIAEKLFGTDVVSTIFSFLDVRQLLRFVCVSKEFKSLLTYDHVVRAAMLTGGFPTTSLDRLIPPIRQRKIWIPSPLRLLRTVCGKRCEDCNVKTRFVCETFGLFLCEKCLDKSTKLFRRSKRWKPYLQADRVGLGPRKGSTRVASSYLMTVPRKDKTGDSIGPLVTCQDIELMAAQTTDQTGEEKVAAFIKKCDEQRPQADADAQAILKAKEDNHADAVNRRAAIQEEKLEARDRFGEARRYKSDEVIVRLTELLKDEPETLAILNARVWNSNQNAYTFAQDSIVRTLVMPVLRAPSRFSSKKKLQQLADEIRLAMGEKKLTERYIRQIIDYCDHPDTDSKVMKRTFRINGMRFAFSTPAIRDILKEPLSRPRDLTEDMVQQLADRVKKIAVRKIPGEEVVQKLEKRLEGLPCVADLSNRNWNTWNWSWMFKETYVQEVLYDPISKPQDITEEKLNEMEQKLRSAMDKKLLIQNRMELLLAPIHEQYPEWYSRLEAWSWNSKTNLCFFFHYLGKRVLGNKLYNVDQHDDSKIVEMSNELLAEIQEIEA